MKNKEQLTPEIQREWSKDLIGTFLMGVSAGMVLAFTIAGL